MSLAQVTRLVSDKVRVQTQAVPFEGYAWPVVHCLPEALVSGAFLSAPRRDFNLSASVSSSARCGERAT